MCFNRTTLSSGQCSRATEVSEQGQDLRVPSVSGGSGRKRHPNGHCDHRADHSAAPCSLLCQCVLPARPVLIMVHEPKSATNRSDGGRLQIGRETGSGRMSEDSVRPGCLSIASPADWRCPVCSRSEDAAGLGLAPSTQWVHICDTRRIKEQ